MSGTKTERILVIKLSALGDLVLSLPAFQAIRNHHPEAEIVLLTTPPYGELAASGGWFDQIWTDRRPGLGDLVGWLGLARQLRSGGFTQVYDLQRSERSGWYFRLLGRPKPKWIGTVAGCSHRYQPPTHHTLHIQDREAAQLALAGIGALPPLDLSGFAADVSNYGLPERFVLLAPGGAAHRPAKRWPAANFAALALRIAAGGVTPVLLGTGAEKEALAQVGDLCPDAINLCDRTSLLQIATLARGAVAAVGNDTGPMHLIAAAGCPVISLFSGESNPAKVSPRGGKVTILQRDNLADLPVEAVWATLVPVLSKAGQQVTL